MAKEGGERSRLSLYCYLLATLACLLFFLIHGYSLGIDLPTLHLDGAFQTASGLFRLDKGQVAGRDFYPYLGMGLVYTLYMPFKLLGGDLAASVIASHSLVMVAMALSLSSLTYIMLGPATPHRGMCSLALGFTASAAMLAEVALLPDWLQTRFSPGNSLRPLRAAIPYAAAFAFYYATLLRDRRKAYVLLGAAFALTSTWSNDFAIPSLLIAVAGAARLAYEDRQLWKPALFFGTAAMLGTGVLLLLLTGGHVLDLWRYNFLDVAPDQWWYYGPWVEQARVFNPAQLFFEFRGAGWTGLCLLAGLATVLCLRFDNRAFAILLAGSAIFLAASLGSVGGHLNGYFEPFFFWAYAVLAAFCVALINRLSVWSLKVTAVACAAIGLTVVSQTALAYKQKLAIVQADSQRFYVEELGGYLPVTWKNYIKQARDLPATTEVEEYFGIWSAMRRPRPLLRVDSVIHALGQTRKASEQVMAALPEIVVTSRPNLNEWPGWSFSANYWFYRPLLENYKAVAESPYTVLWHKQKTKLESIRQTASCRLANGGRSIEISPPATGFYEVVVEYVRPPGSHVLVLLENGILHRELLGGSLSLPLDARAATFPAHVSPQNGGIFSLSTLPTTAARATLNSCSASRLSATALQVLSQVRP